MRLRSFLPFALVSLACSTVPLPPPQPTARPTQFPSTMTTFPTGARAVVYQTAGFDRVSVTVSYGVGSGDDPTGKEGLAHLVEHLTFRARPYGANSVQVKTRLMALGASFNAFTAADNTDYIAWVPVWTYGATMSLEAARMRDPLGHVTEEVFKAERDVVIAELRERREEFRELEQYEWMEEVALAGHPYGRRSTPESVASITLEEARAFAKQHYTPANAIIVVRGPQTPLELMSGIQNGFEGLLSGRSAPKRGPDDGKLPELPLTDVKPRVEKRYGAVDLPRVWMAWTVPGLGARRNVQQGVFASQLAGALSMKFWEDDRVTETFAFPVEMHGVGLIVASAEITDAKHAEAVIERMKDAAHSAKAGALGAQVRVRPYALTNMVEKLEEFFGSEVAQWVRTTGQGNYFAGNYEQVQAVLTHPIDEYGFTYLVRERAHALVVLSDPKALATGAKAEGRELRHDVFEDTEDLLQFGEKDVSRIARAPALEKGLNFKMKNGLSVVVVERHHAPIVDVRLVVRTPLPPPQGSPLAAGELALVTSRFSHDDRHSDWVGARSTFKPGGDHWAVRYRAASGNVLHVLDDLSRWAREQPVHQEYFLPLQRLYKREMQLARSRPRDIAELALDAAVYPDHAYSRLATPEDVQAVGLGDLREFVGSNLRPDQATLIVVGDVDATPKFKEQIEALFGEWSGEQGAKPLAAPPMSPATTVKVFDRPGTEHASIHLGLRTWPVEPAARANAEALRWWIGNKLQRGLRDSTGASYGVHARLELLRSAGAMFVETSVDRKLAASTIAAIKAELTRVANGELSEEEAARARGQVARDYDLRFMFTGGIASRLEEAAVLDQPPSYWDALAAAYPGISVASLAEAARTLDLTHAAILVVGDAAALVPQLEAAGLKVELVAAPATAQR